jgi:hypothetical protein
VGCESAGDKLNFLMLKFESLGGRFAGKFGDRFSISQPMIGAEGISKKAP